MASSERPSPRRLARLAVLVFASTVALFWSARGGEFVRYDDDEYVLENDLVTSGLEPSALGRALTESHAANWHPLTWWSHALDVELFGLDPAGHHLGSILLHAGTAVLLFVFVARSTGRVGAAAFVALLFAWHPLRVESVAWVSERKDVLSGFFALATLVLYARWSERPSAARYAAALAAFALGLMAKPMLVTLPLVLLLVDRWPLDRSAGLAARVREKLPFLALAALTVAVTVLAQSAEGATATLDSLSFSARVENAFVATGTYVVQTLFPVGLACIYPHPATLGESQLVPASAWALALATAALLAWRARASSPWLIVGLAWFVAMLLPVIGIVQVGLQAHADRYTYLPTIGVVLALVFAIDRRLAARSELGHAVPALGVVVLGTFALLTHRQIGVWRDTETLFGHALDVTERNYVAHRKLAIEAREDGRIEDAVLHLEAELRIHADADARAALAVAYLESGDGERALDSARIATELAPERPDLLAQRGAIALSLGANDVAERALRAALDAGLDEPDLHFNLGVLAQGVGDAETAEARYRRALALAPTHLDASNNLAELLLASGRTAEAIEAFQALVALAPDDPISHYNLGIALERAERLDEAHGEFRRALELMPSFEPARAKVAGSTQESRQ